jgi:hypothetical protein
VGLFDGVSFHWDGRTVAIPPDRLLGALARIEEHITLDEMVRLDGTHHAKVAEGFAAVLRHAGVEADGDAVYLALLPDPDARQAAYAAIGALIESTAPPPRCERRKSGGEPAAARSGLVEGLFKALVGRAGLAPRDFWSLTPREAWWMVEAKTPEQMVTKTMSESEAAEIYEAAYGSDED